MIKEQVPRVSIGMPVYNGERFIRIALDSLLAQTFTDFELIISDNASTDKTGEICEEYAEKDNRIRYVRQEENKGASFNFKFVLQQARGGYFMWAAHDDEWDRPFVEACVRGLESSQDKGLAFTNIVNIDSFGRTIREYPSLSKYSLEDRTLSIINFVLDPGCLGKANIIYGIYKISNDKLKNFIIKFLSSEASNCYASDVALNLGVLCRAGLHIDERVLFRKRIPMLSDNIKQIRYYPIDKFAFLKSFINDDFKFNKREVLDVAIGTDYEGLVRTLIEYRENMVKEMSAFGLGKVRFNLLKSRLRSVSKKIFSVFKKAS